MAQKPLEDNKCKDAFKLLQTYGSIEAAAKVANANYQTFINWLNAGVRRDLFTEQDVELAKKDHEVRTLRAEVDDLNEKIAENTDYTLDAANIKNEIFGFKESMPEVPNWVIKPKESTKKSIGVPVLFFSDLHWAEVIDPNQIEGVNSFNPRIGKARIKRLVENTIMLLKNYISNTDYPGIVVPLGGDMMSGDIHEELVETNFGTSMQALVELQGVMIWALEKLADQFGNVYCPAVPGNHTRLTKKPHAKNAVFKTLDWLLYQQLRFYFETKKDKRIVIMPSDSLDTQFKLYNTTYRLTHGDQFRGGGGIQGALSPWMIGDYRKRKRQQAINNSYDYMLMGHWHELAWIKGIVVNGSIKGYDEYAYRNNFQFQLPQQALWINHPDHGMIHWMPVFLEDNIKNRVVEWCSFPNAPMWSPSV